jgi:hypothetical protein
VSRCCVTMLFSSLPVRLRVAVKEAAKSLAQMKGLYSFVITKAWLGPR